MLSDDVRPTAAGVPTETERFASVAREFGLADIPRPVREAAKLHLLDLLGCGLAAHALGEATQGRSLATALGGEERASVIGLERRVPAPYAALANGMLCHGLDFDDTHPGAVSHVTAVVGPAAIAASEDTRADGESLLIALIWGTELAIRIGLAAPGRFHARGLHATAICGVFGAAAAGALLYGLDEGETVHALGIAGSMASGGLEYLDAGTETKQLHAGWAAQSGLMAARLAQFGATGPDSILGGRFGLYASLLAGDDHDVDLATQFADLGERWETPEIAYKLYPACHYVHGCLGAAALVVPDGGFDAGDVDEVVVRVPESAVPIVLEPVAAKRVPESTYEAKFSLQYSVASMLLHGRVDLKTYEPAALTDADALDLAGRVRYEVCSYTSYPGAFPGGVSVRLRSGEILERELDHQPGSTENPASPEQLREKFRANASLALDDEAVERLEGAVAQVEQRADIAGAFAPLREAAKA